MYITWHHFIPRHMNEGYEWCMWGWGGEGQGKVGFECIVHPLFAWGLSVSYIQATREKVTLH